MNRYLYSYLNSYRGLSRPTWMLAIVMLINRTGAMVLPFLGIYMTTKLGFSLKEAGYVLSCYGIGAVLGSLAGGWLTDKFGHFKIQVSSLFLAVPVFAILPRLTGIVELSAGIFILSFITDIFRPANSVSISSYARRENITRAFSLNRMAINLGFSIGPALGGFFAAISYNLLFYGNAASSAMAGLVFFLYFNNRETRRRNKLRVRKENEFEQPGISPWRDAPFLVFTFLCCLFSLCFFQLLNTLPLYYKEIYGMKNYDIGLLLAFNGVVVFTLEMFLVSVSERRLDTYHIIILGTVLAAISFLVLLLTKTVFILYLSMFLLSIAEILLMPFTSTVAIHRAGKGKQGAYMGLNSLSFSAAHILSPLIGTSIAAAYGFNNLWLATAALAFLTTGGFWWNSRNMRKKKASMNLTGEIEHTR